MTLAATLRAFAAFLALGLAPAAAESGSITTWSLTDEDIRSMAIPDSVFAILARHRDIEYADTLALLTALNQDLSNYPKQARIASNVVRTDLDLASDPIAPEIDAFDLLPPLKIWMDSLTIADFRRLMSSKAGLRPIPSPLLDQLGGLVGVEFPTLGLLHSAARSRLALALGRGRYANELRRGHGLWQPIDSTVLDSLIRGMRDDSALADLIHQGDRTKRNKADLESIKRPLKTLRLLRRIPSIESVGSGNLNRKTEALIDSLYAQTLQAPVAAFAAKLRPIRLSSPPRWTDDACGCTRSSPDNQVYGFYLPPVPGRDSGSTTERIDFEVLQRIEYLGLTFDRNGELLQGIPADSSDAFLRVARSHGTRVDWVITQTDPAFWASLTPSARTALFTRLRQGITDLLQRPSNSLWERIKARLPFPRTQNFGWGDGITLHFPTYPSSPEAVAAFDSLYRHLLVSLDSLPGSFHLNLMFPAAGLPARNGGFGSYDHIRRLLELLESVHPDRSLQTRPSRILILMDSPAEDSRRLIQRHIDETFSSDTRRQFLHSLVPVLFPQTRSLSGLKDEVTYFNDTYFAMGVWPLPSTPLPDRPTMTAQDSLGSVLWTYFAPEDRPDRQSRIAAFFCTHRWPLRLAFLASLVAATIGGLFLLSFCRLRQRIGHHMPLVVAGLVFLPLSQFSLVLFVDPDLASVREGNIPYLIVSGLFLLTVSGAAIYFRTRKPKPSREALRQALAKLQGDQE